MSTLPTSVLLAGAVLVAGCATSRPQRVAASFSGEALRAPGPAAGFRPGRPTVINFFAAWCTPCRREMPVLEAAHRRAAAGVDFVGVDEADNRRLALELLDASGTTYPTVYDPDRRIARQYHLAGTPTTLFVGADGRIDAVVEGPIAANVLGAHVRRLSAGRKAR